MKTLYTNLYTITPVQQKIVRYITYWVHTEKTPVPQKEIIAEMERRGEKSVTVLYSLNGLLKLGYIRKAAPTSDKRYKASYVQQKTI